MLRGYMAHIKAPTREIQDTEWSQTIATIMIICEGVKLLKILIPNKEVTNVLQLDGHIPVYVMGLHLAIIALLTLTQTGEMLI